MTQIDFEQPKEGEEVFDISPDVIPITPLDITQDNVLSYPTVIGSTLRGGKMIYGSGNSCLRFEEGVGLWMGNAAFASAPFRINMAGALTASSVTITGLDADDIGETATKKWAGETGADITSAHVAASIASQGALATLNVVAAAQIATGAVEEAKIAADAVTAAKIAVAGLDGTTGNVAADHIVANMLQTDCVISVKIQADAVTAPKINVVGLDGTTGRIVVADVTDANVIAGGVNSYATTLIQAGKILISGSTTLDQWGHATDVTKIDGGKIYTGSVTATQITVTNLAAINADLGTVTAGTITGLTIQTDAGATAGIKMDSTSLRGYSDLGAVTFELVRATGAIRAVDAIFENSNIVDTFVAGENITAGDAVSTIGYFELDSTQAECTATNYISEYDSDGIFKNALYSEAYAGTRKRAFIRFNLSELPVPDDAYYEIIQVILNVYCLGNTIPIQIQRVTETWDEDTLCWDEQPAVADPVYWTGTPTLNQYNAIDLTSWYVDVGGSGPIHGLRMSGVSGTEGQQTNFRGNQTAGQHPYLTIKYRSKISGEIYLATGEETGCADGFIGFAYETKTAGQNVRVSVSGIENTHTGLSVGKRYYLTDTKGQIATADAYGTFPVLVGKAITTAKLLIYNNFENAESIAEKGFYISSADIYESSDAVKSTTSTDYVKVKEFLLPGDFETQELSIYFELKDNDGLQEAYGRIYKNGTSFGTEQHNHSANYVGYTKSLAFQANDRIQIYIKIGTATYTASIQYFRILGTNVLTTKKYNVTKVLE